MNPLELWAGPECTVNRVGATVRDQCDETGFASRLDDLDRLADLGIRCIRFPLLWERTVDAAGRLDWAWADARIERMQRLRLTCIAGLLHHGSGPPHTHLLDPAFAGKFADFAGAVAKRYPHLSRFTPINEPGTTARFSGLYGVWFPHVRSDPGFVRALLHQVLGTRAAMDAIRAVSPNAALVQTEDIGFTQASASLQYQADFENHRRWLPFDLLTGRVTPSHALWPYLTAHGARREELESLVRRPCPPDLLGVNHYVTSERYLDERVDSYAEALRGGNARHRYADVETVRVLGAAPGGSEARLGETWARYRIPVALTEAHLGCTREEQLRWLRDAWDGAQRARARGDDVRAVVAWAAMGTMDWDSLVTRNAGRYEPGLWDVRSTLPRPTALARLARELAAGTAPSHPVLAGAGWWRRSLRHRHPVVGCPVNDAMAGRPILICGTEATLGGAFARLCHMRGLPYRLLGAADLDTTDRAAVEAALARWDPWAIVNAVGLRAATSGTPDLAAGHLWCRGPVTLARACRSHGIQLAAFSSDTVFGHSGEARVESADVEPDCFEGDMQAETDRQVMVVGPGTLIARSAGWFCAWDTDNPLTKGLDALRRGAPFEADAVHLVCSTYVRDFVMATLDLLVDREQGVWHLSNRGAVTHHRLLIKAATLAGLDVSGLREAPVARGNHRGMLATERGHVMPTLADALGRYIVEADPGRRAADQTHRVPRTVEPFLSGTPS